MHAVVVHARLQRLVGGAVRGVEPELGHARRRAHGIAPAEQHRRLVLRAGREESSSADGPIGVNVSAGAVPRAPVAHADSPAKSDRAPAPRSQSRRDRRAARTSPNAVT